MLRPKLLGCLDSVSLVTSGRCASSWSSIALSIWRASSPIRGKERRKKRLILIVLRNFRRIFVRMLELQTI